MTNGQQPTVHGQQPTLITTKNEPATSWGGQYC